MDLANMNMFSMKKFGCRIVHFSPEALRCCSAA
jgi:hypothetical protein